MEESGKEATATTARWEMCGPHGDTLRNVRELGLDTTTIMTFEDDRWVQAGSALWTSQEVA